jgi:hypothetical protein
MAISQDVWEKIEKEYVCGITVNGSHKYPTLSDLAQKYNVSVGSVHSHKEDDRWDDKRTLFKNKTMQKHFTSLKEKLSMKANTLVMSDDPIFTEIEQEADAIAENLASFDLDCMYIAVAVIQIAVKSFKALHEQYGDKNVVLPPKTIKDIISYVEIAQRIGKTAIGDVSAPNEDNQINVTIREI